MTLPSVLDPFLATARPGPGRAAARFGEAAPGEGTARRHRTGDLVRETADGTLVRPGRIDHQIKIRGHRADPLDVEDAIGRLPAVAAVVTALSTTGEHTALVACAVPALGGAAPDGEGTGDRAAVPRARLCAPRPGHPVPDRIVARSALPAHTRTGTAGRVATRDRYL
ncbi:hypothetical protein E2C11_18535 [Streptomyces lavendulae]|nr:hypothetical protein [Streptomyces lavendulae]TXJ77457.1 hypothetical protein E2C11_18535 [Streptomyces lavendulae]